MCVCVCVGGGVMQSSPTSNASYSLQWSRYWGVGGGGGGIERVQSHRDSAHILHCQDFHTGSAWGIFVFYRDTKQLQA